MITWFVELLKDRYRWHHSFNGHFFLSKKKTILFCYFFNSSFRQWLDLLFKFIYLNGMSASCSGSDVHYNNLITNRPIWFLILWTGKNFAIAMLLFAVMNLNCRTLPKLTDWSEQSYTFVNDYLQVCLRRKQCRLWPLVYFLSIFYLFHISTMKKQSEGNLFV